MPMSAKKQRRVCDTKVRTGCITCKKRHIKCDEAKPQCNKCCSTGRVCDGYSSAIRIVNTAGFSQTRRTEIGPMSLLMLSESIEGTATEKQFFFTCRRATEAGMALHICNVSSFWARLAPRLGHHDEAVKHALAALGGAFHLWKLVSVPSTSSYTIGMLDTFIIQQYNMSIKKLRMNLFQQKSERTESRIITLICCLLFTYLENLRMNHAAAVAHLKNGIRIIETSWDTNGLPNSSSGQSNPRSSQKLVSADDMWDVIMQFRDCELCIHCFSSDVPMTLGRRLYKRPSLGQPTPKVRSFTSLSACHEARNSYGSEVLSRDSELKDQKHDAQARTCPLFQQEISLLRQKGALIDLNLRKFLNSPNGPDKGTWDYYSIYMDLLHVTSVRGVVELLPFPPDTHFEVMQTPNFQDQFINEMVSFGEEIHRVNTTIGGSPSDFSLESALVGPMYWACTYSNVPEVQERALNILQETIRRKEPWDAELIGKVLQASSRCALPTSIAP